MRKRKEADNGGWQSRVCMFGVCQGRDDVEQGKVLIETMVWTDCDWHAHSSPCGRNRLVSSRTGGTCAFCPRSTLCNGARGPSRKRARHLICELGSRAISGRGAGSRGQQMAAQTGRRDRPSLQQGAETGRWTKSLGARKHPTGW